MNLTDLYQRLALSELSNLALVDNGSIQENEKAKIIQHANDGLKRLYARFILKEDNLFLEQRGYITHYSLSKKHAQSLFDANAGYSFYINDLGRPFNDDVIKVLEVWDGYGQKLPLNEPYRWRSLFTPQPLILQVPHPIDGATLSVLYQACHPKLTADDDEQLIELPEFLVNALTSFIAYKVYSNMNTAESTAKGAEHFKAFDMNCVEAVEQDLVTTGGMTSGIRFEKNGWV